MKKSIIDEICFNGESLISQVVLSDEYKKLSANALKYYNKLNEVLNDEQKKILDKYAESEFGVCAVAESLFFKEGLKTGMLLIMECII